MKKETTRHVLFVINPISGDIGKDDLEEEIAAVCGEHKVKHSFYKTTGKRDKETIKGLLETNDYDTVFAVGGDGTVNLVASLLIGTDISLGIIPLGSGNGLSKDLNIPQDTEEALTLLHHYTVKRIDAIELNGHYSIHLSDLGFNARVVNEFCKGNSRGPGAYAWIAMQEYLNYEPKRYRIVTDKESFEGEAFMVTIANANSFGSNANINPGGILNDGRFEICLIEPFPRAASIGILYKLYTDNIDDSVYTRRMVCRYATIYNLEGEVMHIDGEPIDVGKEVKVTIHPKCLKVILPAKEDAS